MLLYTLYPGFVPWKLFQRNPSRGPIFHSCTFNPASDRTVLLFPERIAGTEIVVNLFLIDATSSAEPFLREGASCSF